MKLNKSIGYGAFILAASTILSYGLGLLRDRGLTGAFGAGYELDIYNASFLLPDFIMSSFGAALTAAFVPVFTTLRQKEGDRKSWELTNSVFSLINMVLLVGIILAAIAAPIIAKIVAPGFDAEKQNILVQTTRIMLISPFLFSFSTLFGNALQSLRRFISYALSPILYNAGIIIGIYFFVPRFGLFGAIYGVLIGAFLHLLVRLIEIIYTGWNLRFRNQYFFKPWQQPEIKKMIRLIIPRALDLLIWQINLWSYTAIASSIAYGSIAIFNLARNFQSMPVSFFGIAFATSMFPALAASFAEKNKPKFIEDLTKTIRQVLFFTLPAAAGMAVLGKPLVSFFLQNGKFTDEAVASTGLVLAVFALSIPLESLQYLLTRGFYAQHNTKTPVLVTIIATIINISVSYVASKFLGTTGLALGFICYTSTQVILLSILLQKKINFLGFISFTNILKIIISAAIMALAVYFILPLFSSIKIAFVVSVIAGAGIYLLLALFLKIPEISSIYFIINKKILKR
ncbi:MAG: murein biosynthesis integral membrane protein MurJ [Patescibacteria group bacterium]|jgi:putative peptidoglycan lipid II flippase